MERFKYPRTRHLPSSRSSTEDDKVASSEDVRVSLTGQEVIITEKMDGENTSIYADGHSHARSIDSKFHPSRSIVRELAGTIAHELPEDFRICGENLFAVHSIEYADLPAHFVAFGVWAQDRCLSWDDTVEWCGILDVELVPVLYRGEWKGEAHALSVWRDHCASLPEDQASEGFVVRLASELSLSSFSNSCFKYVRPRHVQTDQHWMHQEVRMNGLRAHQGQ